MGAPNNQDWTIARRRIVELCHPERRLRAKCRLVQKREGVIPSGGNINPWVFDH